MRRIAIALAILMATLLGTLTSQNIAHAAQHQAFTCSAAYWKTEYSSGTIGPEPYGVYLTVTLEAWTANTGEYCSYIRTKSYAQRGSSDCDNLVSEDMWDGNGASVDSNKTIVWSGCGTGGYALYGNEVYSYSYPCPFTAYGSVTETPSPGYTHHTQTAPHCTL